MSRTSSTVRKRILIIINKRTKSVCFRIFLGLCENEQYRGPIVAAGGGKVYKKNILFIPQKLHFIFKSLLPLTLEGTPVGKTKAAQALAKVTITNNPEIAFPGQRVRK